MSPRTFAVGILALVCGVTASIGVNYLRQAPAAVVEKPDVTVVPVAAIDIKRGQTVTEDMMIGREWPKELIPPGSILLKADIVGKIAQVPIVKDEPIFSGKIGDSEKISGMVPPGFRAYTILTPNDASLVAGLIEPGDKVDVLFTDKTSDKKITGGGSTAPLLQNIEVLAMGQAIDPSESRERSPRNMRSVTLVVPLEMATMLTLAQEMGTLHLALRSQDDEATADVSAVTMRELLRTVYPALYIEEEVEPEPVEPVVVEVPTETAPTPEIEIRVIRGMASSTVVMQSSEARSAGVRAVPHSNN